MNLYCTSSPDILEVDVLRSKFLLFCFFLTVGAIDGTPLRTGKTIVEFVLEK